MATIGTQMVPVVHARALSSPSPSLQKRYGACPVRKYVSYSKSCLSWPSLSYGVRNYVYRSYSGSCLSWPLLQSGYGAIKPCPVIKSVCRSHLASSPSPASETKIAYIEVDDMTNLDFFGAGLHNLGYTLVSTGETASVLESAGVPVTAPEHVTTLYQDGLKHQNGERISASYVLALNYNPLRSDETIKDPSEIRGFASRLFRIVRASTMRKNTLVVVDPQDYCSLLSYLEQNLQDRKFHNMLALKHFHHLLAFGSSKGIMSSESTIPFTLGGGMAKAIQHHGKEMSFGNYLEADFAWNCVTDFLDPTCAVMKGRRPCGIVSRDDIREAHKLAVQSDPLGAYGGILTFNVEVDEALAVHILELRNPKNGDEMLYETVIAPGYSQKGLEILCGKSKNLRVLEAVKNKRGELYYQHVSGGWLPIDDNQFRIATDRSPTRMELDDLKFAWVCAKHGAGNGIVLGKNKCMLSWCRSQSPYLGAVLANSSVYPSDWKHVVKEACENGVTAIVQLGNFRRGENVIYLCNQYGVSLLFARDD